MELGLTTKCFSVLYNQIKWSVHLWLWERQRILIWKAEGEKEVELCNLITSVRLASCTDWLFFHRLNRRPSAAAHNLHLMQTLEKTQHRGWLHSNFAEIDLELSALNTHWKPSIVVSIFSASLKNLAWIWARQRVFRITRFVQQCTGTRFLGGGTRKRSGLSSHTVRRWARARHSECGKTDV